MSILKDIPDLIQADVITPETGERIREYYKNKHSGGPSTNRLFVIFGVLGAVLAGLGIILIVAHNWDGLSRGEKTVFAFLPLLVGQVLCGYALVKKRDSIAWKESGAAFLFFSVGAAIALVSQIYNLPGDVASFLRIWALLCFPLIYVMGSSVASLLYIAVITYYAVGTYWSYPFYEAHLYWLLLLLALPHYYRLYKKKPESNFIFFHHWFIPLSVIVALGTVSKGMEELMFISYFSLFGLFYSLGSLRFFRQQKTKNNSYGILGSLGTVILLLVASFHDFWRDFMDREYLLYGMAVRPEFWAATITTLLAAGLLYFRWRGRPLRDMEPLALVFALFIVTFILGVHSPMVVVLINIYIFVIGILTIREGAKRNHLGILNYGLILIMMLVFCRFFDTDLSFVFRGVLFLLVGSGFFVANYWMLKKRRQ